MTPRRSRTSAPTGDQPEPPSRMGGGVPATENQGATCKATTAAGLRCSAPVQSGTTLCFFHDPARAGEQQDARRAGGRQRQRPTAVLGADFPAKDIQSVADVKGLLSETIHQVRTGAIDPKIANCIGYLSGILLKAIEVGDIEERLAAMEAVVGQSQRTGLAGDFDRPLPGEDGDHEGDSDDKEDAA
jgi:hypothetical protein